MKREPKKESEALYRRRIHEEHIASKRPQRRELSEWDLQRTQRSRPQGRPDRRGEGRTDKQQRTYRQEKDYYKKSLNERRYKTPYDEDSYGVTTRKKRASFAERRATAKQEKLRKKKKRKIVLRVIGVFFLLLIIAAAVIWFTPSYKAAAIKAVLKSPLGPIIGRSIIGESYDAYVWDKNFDESKVAVHSGVKVPDGNMTIALLGVDARAEDLQIGTLADSMVVVNVDSEGNIKMGSVYRDTYLMSRAQDGTEIISKANSAYFRGGPIGAVNMLNENLDLAITDYVVVNFWGLANIIDLLGGIRLTVSQEEMDALNYHMLEQNIYGGTEYVPLTEYGENILLTGDQATAFCRLRSVTFYSPEDGIEYRDDYGRTARQRYTLTELLEQTREQGVLRLMKVADELFEANAGDRKFIQTSLDINELIKLFIMGYDMNMAGSEGFPHADYQYPADLDSGNCVVADTLEENVTLMHRFLYGTENYDPTPELKELAGRIRNEVFRQIGY